MIRFGLLAAALLVTAGCGKKPEPRPRPARPDAHAAAPAPGPAALSATANRTAGGVSLAGIPEALATTASRLATRPASATRALIEAGPAAREVATALLASANLEELTGALAYLRAVPTPSAAPKVAALLGHGAARVRAAARETLAGYDAASQASGVIALLKHEDPAVRVDAARALGGLRAVEAAPALLAALKDSSPDVAAEAAVALARLGVPVDAAALAALVADDAAPTGLRTGLFLHRRKGVTPPAAAVDKALASDDAALAAEGARAIPTLTKDRAARIARAEADPRADVRRALLEALAAAPRLSSAATSFAAAAITDPDPALRATAVDVIGRLTPADRAVAALAPHLSNGASAVARRAAAARLSASDAGDAAAAALAARLDAETDGATANLLIQALIRMDTRASLTPLLARLDSKRGPKIHHALATLAGEVLGDTAAAQRWLDARHPAPVKAAPAPANAGAKAKDGDAADRATP